MTEFFFNVLLLVHKTPRVACSLFVVTCFSENEMDVVVVVVRTGSVSFKGFLKNIYHVERDGFQSLSSHLFMQPSQFHYKRRKTQTIQPYHRHYCIFVPCFVVTLFFLEINQTYLKLPVPFVLIYFST